MRRHAARTTKLVFSLFAPRAYTMPIIKPTCCCALMSMMSTAPTIFPPPTPAFNPKKVLILTKLSRLEFEKLRHRDITDKELERVLKKRGSDYNTLLYHHYIHKGCESRVETAFKAFGVETRLVNRFDYTEENIDWADVIVTTGGDGTFLMAACRIQDREKPIIGFNSDPTRSIGYLCLPKKYSINVRDAVNKLFSGEFRWTFRRRIRISLIGESVFQPPIELHDQQLSHPEYRFFECLQEQHKSASRNPEDKKSTQTRVLPVLALNEVYFGECVSARVSYFEVATDNGEKVKTKNAGVCVSTGTGSTSWSYNISKISSQTVKEIIQIIKDEAKGAGSKDAFESLKLLERKGLEEKVSTKYNNNLIFNAENNKMLYTIRDPISSYSLPCAEEIVPRGYVDKLEIKSRCFDACLVIDGGLSFSFNDGTSAIMEMHESDALRTVVEIVGDNGNGNGNGSNI
jgi:NAD+ kinase